jgi:hypothetical protein
MSEKILKKELNNEILDDETNDISIYEMISRNNEVLYIGVGPLRSMLEEHLPGGVFEMPDASYYRRFTAGEGLDLEKQRSLLLEDMNEICGKKPRYNK